MMQRAMESYGGENLRGAFIMSQLPDGRMQLEVRDHDHFIRFDNGLLAMLGLSAKYQEKWIGYNDYDIATQPIDMCGGANFFLVHSDIVDMTRVGNRSSRVLRCVSTGSADASVLSDTVVMHFPNVYYMPVAKTFVDTISVAIYSDFGNLVHFTPRGKTLLVLHFRRRSGV
jgi:hypothetical protein